MPPDSQVSQNTQIRAIVSLRRFPVQQVIYHKI